MHVSARTIAMPATLDRIFEQRSRLRPVCIVACLLAPVQVGSAQSHDPLTREEARHVLSGLAAYQDQFHGKLLEAELEVEESDPLAAGGAKVYAERVVADGKGDRLRWQTVSRLGNIHEKWFIGITVDYAWDGWRGTKLTKDLDGRTRHATIFCDTDWPPKDQTANQLLQCVGFEFFDDWLTRERTLLKFLALRKNVYRTTHPRLGAVVCFESGRRGSPLQCYLREQPEVHFVGFTKRIENKTAVNADGAEAKDGRWVIQLEMDYEKQAGHWLPKEWAFATGNPEQPMEKSADAGYHVECVVKKLQFLADVPAESFRIDLPPNVRVVDDCRER